MNHVKLPTDEEKDVIFNAIKIFQSKSYEKIRESIHIGDKCFNYHGDPKGHPLTCCNGYSCSSVQRL